MFLGDIETGKSLKSLRFLEDQRSEHCTKLVYAVKLCIVLLSKEPIIIG